MMRLAITPWLFILWTLSYPHLNLAPTVAGRSTCIKPAMPVSLLAFAIQSCQAVCLKISFVPHIPAIDCHEFESQRLILAQIQADNSSRTVGKNHAASVQALWRESLYLSPYVKSS